MPIVIATNANRKNQKTVNIVGGTTKPAHAKGHVQATTASNTAHQFATFQDSGGTVKGLPTIWINNYSGPA